jgi:transcriptional regulator with XRE-family HTH domain
MEDTEHWRQRLVELKTALGITQAAMAAAIGVEPSYLSRLLYPPGKAGRKNLGLDTMRALRSAYGLRADWFDLPLGSVLPGQGVALGVAEAVAAYGNAGPLPGSHKAGASPLRSNGVAWPFKEVSYQRLQALKKSLGPKLAGEALHDLDTLLDVAVARWEQRAHRLSKRAS